MTTTPYPSASLQVRIGEYVDRTWPRETVMHAALGLCEEAGEVGRAVLKRRRKIGRRLPSAKH